MNKISQKMYDRLGQELAEKCKDSTKQALILDFCTRHGIKPTQHHSTTVITKKQKKMLPSLFGESNAK